MTKNQAKLSVLLKIYRELDVLQSWVDHFKHQSLRFDLLFNPHRKTLKRP